jgi:transcription termination factor NusB
MGNKRKQRNMTPQKVNNHTKDDLVGTQKNDAKMFKDLKKDIQKQISELQENMDKKIQKIQKQLNELKEINEIKAIQVVKE